MKKAVVASGHSLVSEAAMEILKNGGNAFDAVIAGGFVSTVAEPALTSLGGGGFLLARIYTGEEVLFDFFTDTPGKSLPAKKLEPHFFPVTVHFPGSEQIFNIGFGSVAVPGNLKGFLHVHKRFGKLPLERILEPAIRAGRAGIPLNTSQAYFINLLKPILTMTREGTKLFCRSDNSCLGKEDLFKNPDYAQFLQTLPDDQGENFYRGTIAQKIAADMTQEEGLLTLADLENYQVIERPPLTVSYRGNKLLTNPPPSFGGELIALALKLLENFDLTSIRWGSSQHLCLIAQIMQHIESIRTTRTSLELLNDSRWQDHTVQNIRRFSRGTTHICVSDDHGNVASMTTSNGEGSGYIVPGTGIMLNNMMGEDDLHPQGFHSSPPGQRIASMMAPTLVMSGKQVSIALGSGGSKRIRTAIMQVICNILDFKLNVKDAVDLPRIHWDGEVLQIEPGFPQDSINFLKKQYPINLWKNTNMYFGGVQAILPGSSGAGDPRRGGDSQSEIHRKVDAGSLSGPFSQGEDT